MHSYLQVPGLDAIIVPVGGGGLISGIATAAKGLNPSVKIIGAEPAAADDAARSKAVSHTNRRDACMTPASLRLHGLSTKHT